METDDDLEIGEFGIATRMAGVEGAPEGVPAQAEPGATMVYRPQDEPAAAPEPDAVPVSRRHAEVRLEGSNYCIVDLDSTNGVLVNGQPQKRAKLGDGDRITLGSTDVVFSLEST